MRDVDQKKGIQKMRSSSVTEEDKVTDLEKLTSEVVLLRKRPRSLRTAHKDGEDKQKTEIRKSSLMKIRPVEIK